MTIQEIYRSYGKSSGYGYRPQFGDFHFGVDLLTPIGIAIHADMDGVLRLSGQYDGGEIIVNQESLDSLVNVTYGHLSKYVHAQGKVVRKGDLLGYTGRSGNVTGPHCHYERDKGKFKGSIDRNHLAGTTYDPEPYLKGINMPDSLHELTVRRAIEGAYLVSTGEIPPKAIVDQKVVYVLEHGGFNQVLSDIFGLNINFLSQVGALSQYFQGRELGGDTYPGGAEKFALDRINGGDNFKKVMNRDMPSYVKAINNPSTCPADVVDKSKKYDSLQNPFQDIKHIIEG